MLHLDEWIKARGMTRKSCAKKMKMSYNQLSRYARQDLELRYNSPAFRSILKVLDVTPTDLLYGPGVIPSSQGGETRLLSKNTPESKPSKRSANEIGRKAKTKEAHKTRYQARGDFTKWDIES